MKIVLIVSLVVVVCALVWVTGQYLYVKYKLEKPDYVVIEKKDGYEIREYAPYITASVKVQDDGRAMNSGFSLVADYIFGNNTKRGGSVSESVAMTAPVVDGKNSENVAMTAPVIDKDLSKKTNESVAMTAPVIDKREGDKETRSESVAMTSPVLDARNSAGTRVVSFVMPSKYTIDTLPIPNNKRVKITEVPAQEWAVLVFSGNYDDAKKIEKYEMLKNLLERDGVEYTSEWQSAGYDPPFTLPFMKRNEVWIKLEK